MTPVLEDGKRMRDFLRLTRRAPARYNGPMETGIKALDAGRSPAAPSSLEAVTGLKSSSEAPGRSESSAPTPGPPPPRRDFSFAGKGYGARVSAFARQGESAAGDVFERSSKAKEAEGKGGAPKAAAAEEPEGLDAKESAPATVREVKRELLEQQNEILLRGLSDSPALPEAVRAGLTALLEERRAGGEKGGESAEGAKKEEEGEGFPGLPGLPDYWNAENTSQRLVDFALRFAEGQEGREEEFAAVIAGAIARGFAEAGQVTGRLPGAAGALNEKTRELTFEKLDAWLQSRVEAREQPSPSAPAEE